MPMPPAAAPRRPWAPRSTDFFSAAATSSRKTRLAPRPGDGAEIDAHLPREGPDGRRRMRLAERRLVHLGELAFGPAAG